LEEEFDIAADVWSVTSYKELFAGCADVERHNMRNPGSKKLESFLAQNLQGQDGIYVAATDYIKALPATIAKWMPRRYAFLGTDGFGRSDHRVEMRDFFEVDARHIAFAALHELAEDERIPQSVVKEAVKKLKIDRKKPNPVNL
jgi:pyruvate dehydrogenase E1 component